MSSDSLLGDIPMQGTSQDLTVGPSLPETK